ncbi:MAG: 4-alpha-glucanotransferase [Candidatus Uhrbacteria bacterium]|nr:4-alpha-glucanotransferase [Candidatus Uhrbacteria bacterium]
MKTRQKKIIGTLLPLSALKSDRLPPGRGGCGTFAMGEVFLRWLGKTEQQAWQLLPLHETHYVSGSRTRHAASPYRGYGVGIDPRYVAEGRLPKRRAVALDEFCDTHKEWLTTYALFCTLRDSFGTDDWRLWPAPLRDRDPAALDLWTRKLHDGIEKYKKNQYVLHASFDALRKKAANLGITLIGDLSFYLPLQSPLVWQYADAFEMKPGRAVRFVSGLPDGLRAHYGRQLWGHPLYAWSSRPHRINALWRFRLRYLGSLYDMIRVDHAQGFYRYGRMDSEQANNDMLKYGPGTTALSPLLSYSAQNGITLFAEDAGHRIPALKQTLAKHQVPGIRIARFLYNEKLKKISAYHGDFDAFPIRTVCYTSTHDTEPLLAYVRTLSVKEKRDLSAYLLLDSYHTDRAFACALRNKAICSPAQMTLVQFQDWFLRTERMNIPGTEGLHEKNWRYRIHIPVERLQKARIACV